MCFAVHRVFFLYMAKERVYVYIDWQNFYNAIKREQFYFESFKIKEFVQFLVWDHREIMWIRYYVWQVRQFEDDPESKRIYDAQQKTFSKLKEEGLYIVMWRMQKIGNIYHEKWVDVKIAIDLIEWAYEDRYENAIIISSDTDLKPVCDMVIQKWKKVEVVMFNSRAPKALSYPSYNYKILNTSDLLNFGIQRVIPI